VKPPEPEEDFPGACKRCGETDWVELHDPEEGMFLEMYVHLCRSLGGVKHRLSGTGTEPPGRPGFESPQEPPDFARED
jgi:hypothetical protein